MHSIFNISITFRSITTVIIKNCALLNILLFIFLSGSLVGQSQTKVIDSLKLAASKSSDSTKTEIFLEIATKYRIISYDSVVVYGKKALDNAIRFKNNELVIKSLVELAYINFSMGHTARSTILYKRAKQLCIEENNQYYLAKIYLDLERHYNSFSNYAGVLGTLDTALRIINANNLSVLKPFVYREIAKLYLSINDLSTAQYYTELALSFSKDKASYVSGLLITGNIFFKKNNYDSTLYYYKKALSIAKKSNNKILIQKIYRKYADYYIEVKNYDKSALYLDTAIIYCKESHLTNELASLITVRAHISSQKEDYQSALQYNEQALKLRKQTGTTTAIGSSLLNIGSNYTELGNYDKAHSYLNSGLEIAKELGKIYYIAYGYDKLSKLYELEGNFEKALHYVELKAFYEDSIFTNRTNEEVLFFRNQYELERERIISEQLKLERKTNETFFLVIVIVLAGLAIILLIRFNYLRRKSTKEIVKLSSINETTSQAVVIINRRSKIEYVNTGLVKMLGYLNRNELLGKSMFDFTDEDGKKLIENEILPALLTIGHWKGEINNMKKDGSFFICEEICSVISSKDGKPEFYVAIFNNITKRKEAEAELKTSRANLEKTVKTKDKMFSIIAHDLTGPFSSILGLSELMINDYDKYQKDAHIRFCQMIYNSSKNTFELLTNLLHWSRSQLGNIELTKENININELIFSNAELLKLMMDNKEITLHNNVSSNISAYIDNNTISVVIRNLLNNAIKFTPRGGSIKVAATKKDSTVDLTISDTGIGIDKKDIVDLFKINKNVARKGTENERGTGLGLILCKEFTELNNGQISIESEIGKGSEFKISLPIG